MACNTEFDELDDEITELIKNYKSKKATVLEPCTAKNIRECLIGLSEECGLLNITYLFNPYIDIENGVLPSEALVNLINNSWTLLQNLKSEKEKSTKLSKQNHDLMNTVTKLNKSMDNITEIYISKIHEARAAGKKSSQSEEIYQELSQTKAQLSKVTKQKDSLEKKLRNEINRLEVENDKLLHKKAKNPKGALLCNEECESTISRLMLREKNFRSVIAQLKANKQNLLDELIAMKEEIVLGSQKKVDLTN